jgi:hypothetical protein
VSGQHVAQRVVAVNALRARHGVDQSGRGADAMALVAGDPHCNILPDI